MRKNLHPFRTKRHRVVGFALLTSLAAAGCAQPDAKVAAQLKQAHAELAARRYASCERITTTLIARDNRPADAALALYLRAQSRLRRGLRGKARLDLNTAQPLARNDPVRAIIETQLANIAFDDDDYARAASLYAEAVPHLPPEAGLERASYQYGVALQRSHRFPEAREVLEDFGRRFPSSKYAIPAQRKRVWEENYFTIQCGAFSQIDRAHQLASDLRRNGISALAYPEIRDRGQRYVVRVGKFRDYSLAQRELRRVRQHQRDAFIVP